MRVNDRERGRQKEGRREKYIEVRKERGEGDKGGSGEGGGKEGGRERWKGGRGSSKEKKIRCTKNGRKRKAY